MIAGIFSCQAAAPTNEEQLLALDKEWVDAEVNHDQEALERILDDKLVVMFASGRTAARKEFIDALLSKPIAPYEVVHDVIRVFGDTAVVVDRFGSELRSNVTWVAIRRACPWRVITETFATLAPAPK